MGEVRPRAAGTTVPVLDQLSIRRTFSPTLTYFPNPRRVISRFPPRPILPILSFTHRAGRETDPTSRDREGSRAGAAPAHQDNGRARVQLPIGDARDQDDRGARHNRFVCRGAGEGRATGFRCAEDQPDPSEPVTHGGHVFVRMGDDDGSSRDRPLLAIRRSCGKSRQRPRKCLVGRVISRFRMFSQLPIVPARRAG